jgi:hypothetical protein
MPFGFKITRRINCEFHVRKPILKFWFIDIGDKKMENVNKGGQKLSKYTKLWAKNAFDEWKLFHGFNTMRSIVDIFKMKI